MAEVSGSYLIARTLKEEGVEALRAFLFKVAEEAASDSEEEEH